MSDVAVMEIAKNALLIGLKVSLPLLLTALIVGVIIGLLMAATQVQEFTLSFVPKLLLVSLVLVMTGPWMLRTLVSFTRTIFQEIPDMAP